MFTCGNAAIIWLNVFVSFVWRCRHIPQSLQTEPKVVGLKQSLKAIREGAAGTVFLADDAEDKVRTPVLAACRERGINAVAIESMALLGESCGIDIGAAVAVVLQSN